MFFPISGIEVNPIIPPLVAFFISAITSPAGISGSFILLPFQVSYLGFTSPAVSPTNLIYNIVAIPGGLYSFIKEDRMVWPITWVMSAGTIPGVIIGSWLRVSKFQDPKIFKMLLGIVMLYLGIMLTLDLFGVLTKNTVNSIDEQTSKKFLDIEKKNINNFNQPGEFTKVTSKNFSLKKIEYFFMGNVYSCNTLKLIVIALFIGLVGGIYGIGGGALITPFLVSMLSLPIYSIAGAALVCNLINSVTGVIVFSLLELSPAVSSVNVSPDWPLGILFGVGGLLGTYAGARAQKHIKEKYIKTVMAIIVITLAISYIFQFFRY